MSGTQIIDLKRSSALFQGLPTEYVIIGIDTAHTSRADHPLWDERAFDEVSEEDIDFAATQEASDGVSSLPPVQVRPETLGDKKVPVIVDGRGRVRSLRLGNERRVAKGLKPLVIRSEAVRLDDADALFYMIARNEHSRNDKIEVKAQKANDLLKQTVSTRLKVGLSEVTSDNITSEDLKKVASAFKVTESAVRNWVSFTTLPEHLQEAVKEGIASPSTAVALARKPVEEQKEVLAKARGKKAPKEAMAPPAGGQDETPADQQEEEAPAPAPRKKRQAAKVTKNAASGGARGKKFWKTLVEDWKEYLPEEVVTGIKLAANLMTDEQLPAKIRHCVQANQWNLGQVDYEDLPKVVQALTRKLKSKTVDE